MKNFLDKLARTLGGEKALNIINSIERYHPSAFHHRADHDDHHPRLSRCPR